jgi:hypothetical protein
LLLSRLLYKFEQISESVNLDSDKTDSTKFTIHNKVLGNPNEG